MVVSSLGFLIGYHILRKRCRRILQPGTATRQRQKTFQETTVSLSKRTREHGLITVKFWNAHSSPAKYQQKTHTLLPSDFTRVEWVVMIFHPIPNPDRSR